MASRVSTTSTATGERADRLMALENVIGSGFSDVIHGYAGGNSLSGGNGNDGLYGESGNDYLDGRRGVDTCHQGPGMGLHPYCETFDGQFRDARRNPISNHD